jgi:alpha/beta superfamily hydrolase
MAENGPINIEIQNQTCLPVGETTHFFQGRLGRLSMTITTYTMIV